MEVSCSEGNLSWTPFCNPLESAHVSQYIPFVSISTDVDTADGSFVSSILISDLAMAEAFKQTQDKWCETWLTDEDLFDAVAVVGPERQRVPFIRTHLATISKPLKAALYGDW